jgi:hypothetical protein
VGGGRGGTATSTLIGTNPFGASTYNLTANATGGNALDAGSATATAGATAANGGIANATAVATGGLANTAGGTATANASVTNGGSAVAQATGGSGTGGSGGGGSANATATSAAMLGGTANATATATGGAGPPPFFPGFGPTVAAAGANSFATTINGMRPRRSRPPLAEAGRPRQRHRPISEVSNRFNLRPQALLMGSRPLRGPRPVQSHRRVVSCLFPTR